jgi:hypothetical protein
MVSIRKLLLPVRAHVRHVEKTVPASQRFGKLAPSGVGPQLEDFLDFASLPAPAVDWTTKARPDWGMMLNDRLGDCTCAGVGHAVQLFTSNTRAAEVTPLTSAVLKLYEAVSGYDPYTGANDNGAYCTAVLERWRTVGLGPAHHKNVAWAKFDYRDITKTQQVIATFGLAYVGVKVPQAWESGPDVWDVSDTPIVGGHCVILVGYTATGPLLVSWGRVYQMTWNAWTTYADEAYAVVSSEWVASNGLSPSGLDLAGLLSELRQL